MRVGVGRRRGEQPTFESEVAARSEVDEDLREAEVRFDVVGEEGGEEAEEGFEGWVFEVEDPWGWWWLVYISDRGHLC